jgi:dihydropteroate synthase-like protein
MRNILFVTGREAAGRLAALVGEENVYVSDVSVAAFINPDALADELLKKKVRASLIVVPGTVSGDVSHITRITRIPCVKGPKNLATIPLMLKNLDKKFSTTKPAEEVLKEELRKENEKQLKKALRSGGGRLTIGRKKRLRLDGLSHVVAEIPDAPLLTKKELVSRARYFLECGASIIDVGMIAGKDNSSEIAGMLDALRARVHTPLSVDSMSEKEILAAADADADLILSLDEATIGLSHSLDVPAVVIPRTKDGKIPATVSERVSLLERLIEDAACPAVADPILNPLGCGFAWSLASYIKFRGRNPEIPMLLGAGNVTELADADSPGVNMVLAGFASELNIQLLFTTEASPKTRGAVAELAAACKMMYLSKTRGEPPKDLGFDLLKLKDKTSIEPVLDPAIKDARVVEVSSERKTKLDAEHFRIYVHGGRINVVYYPSLKPNIAFRGTSARKLYKAVIARGLADGIHAAYIGKELAKAEIALKLRKNYIQGEDLF